MSRLPVPKGAEGEPLWTRPLLPEDTRICASGAADACLQVTSAALLFGGCFLLLLWPIAAAAMTLFSLAYPIIQPLVLLAEPGVLSGEAPPPPLLASVMSALYAGCVVALALLAPAVRRFRKRGVQLEEAKNFPQVPGATASSTSSTAPRWWRWSRRAARPPCAQRASATASRRRAAARGRTRLYSSATIAPSVCRSWKKETFASSRCGTAATRSTAIASPAGCASASAAPTAAPAARQRPAEHDGRGRRGRRRRGGGDGGDGGARGGGPRGGRRRRRHRDGRGAGGGGAGGGLRRFGRRRLGRQRRRVAGCRARRGQRRRRGAGGHLGALGDASRGDARCGDAPEPERRPPPPPNCDL